MPLKGYSTSKRIHIEILSEKFAGILIETFNDFFAESDQTWPKVSFVLKADYSDFIELRLAEICDQEGYAPLEKYSAEKKRPAEIPFANPLPFFLSGIKTVNWKDIIQAKIMSIKNIVALVIVVLLTVVIMQNTDQVKFTVLFSTVYMSKVAMLTGVSVCSFILGVLVGRPKNKKYNISQHYDDMHGKDDPDTLSDEDRDYISRD